MDDCTSQLIAYFKQQQQLDVPPYIFSDSFTLSNVSRGKNSSAENSSALLKTAISPGGRHFTRHTPGPRQTAKPLPAYAFMQKSGSAEALEPPPPSENRTKLADLFHETKKCQNCPLGKARKRFVFGTGNPNALFMVIGEAPGEEEDRQGLPFVGAAGELLTKMLSAIDIDRMKHVFISNTVKCRPPDNRNPDPEEILACFGLLARQIEIIAPKALLLLGRIAAHALLDSTESIAWLRERNGLHHYKNIPAFVTYHPAALLRNDAYRRPAWEDLQKLQKVLKDSGVYDVTT